MLKSGRYVEAPILRAGLLLFGLATCAKVWLGPMEWTGEAQAQIPDAGLQRVQQLEATQQTNKLLAEIKDILENKTLNVRLDGADNQLPRTKPPKAPDK
jgi:hypothetical protein